MCWLKSRVCAFAPRPSLFVQLMRLLQHVSIFYIGISKDTVSKMLCSYFIEETQLGLELARSSYQSTLQEESHTIDLLSTQIDKYYTSICPFSMHFSSANLSFSPYKHKPKKFRTKFFLTCNIVSLTSNSTSCHIIFRSK